MKVKLPKSLLEFFHGPEDLHSDSEEPDNSEHGDSEMVVEGVESVGVANGNKTGSEIQLDMNWNICKYLPEAGSCQAWFRVSIAKTMFSSKIQ